MPRPKPNPEPYHTISPLTLALCHAQTIALCKEAVSGWAQYSMQGRQTALGAAKLAMDSADTCHKELMAVFKTHQ